MLKIKSGGSSSPVCFTFRIVDSEDKDRPVGQIINWSNDNLQCEVFAFYRRLDDVESLFGLPEEPKPDAVLEVPWSNTDPIGGFTDMERHANRLLNLVQNGDPEKALTWPQD